MSQLAEQLCPGWGPRVSGGAPSGAVGGSWTPNPARFFQLAGPTSFLGGPLAALRWALGDCRSREDWQGSSRSPSPLP